MNPKKVSLVAGLAVLAAVITPIHTRAQGTATPPPQAAQTAAAPAAPQAAAPAGKSVIVQRILVKVNGEPFTQTDLEHLQTDVLQQMNLDAPPKGTEPDAVLGAQLLKITPGIIAQAIDDLLLIQRAKELGYKMSEEQYGRIIDNLKKDNKLDDAQFKQAMKDQGLTPESMREKIEHDYLRQAVIQSDVMSHAIMTEQESRQYYAEHQSEFMTQAKVTLREILVSVPSTSTSSGLSFNAATDEAAKDKANQIHDRLAKGEDFAKVAAEASDSPSKATGGLIGDVNVEDMNASLRPTIEALKPGEFTAPLRTRAGYQILKLDSRAASEAKPYDQVKDVVAQKIYDQRVDVETQKYLDKIRASALIEWKDANLKAMYDKQIATLATKKAGGL